MRVALIIIGFVGALICAPWVPAVCVVLLALRYRAWEAIVLGLLIDLTWQPYPTPAVGFFHMIPLFTIASIFVVWAFEPLRSQFLK
jgi:hypothetical protein